MKLISPVFGQNQNIPEKYTCDGEDISPPLEVQEIPEGAKSLVLIMDDPDAPGGTWVHWTVWNIDPETTQIMENSVPEDSVEGITSFGNTGYGGPCPPSGTHRYIFKIYALNAILGISSSSDCKELEKEMEKHIIEKAELVGLYGSGDPEQ
jgi:Raf kinase inhibitor-like YbhB/YbcL family protein